MELIT